jgi:hypothetical protein
LLTLLCSHSVEPHDMKPEFRLLVFFFLISFSSYSQPGRYLEKKGFEERSGDKQNGQFMVSLNKDNDMLAVTDIAMEIQNAKMKMKTNYYSKLLNLRTGRIEQNLEAMTLYYFDNSLLLSDATATNGKWEDMRNVPVQPTYYFDPASGTKEEIPLPQGFFLVGTQGKYIMATNFMAQKTVLIEKEGDSYKTKNQFDAAFLKITEDEKFAYGTTFMSQKVSVFDISTGKLVKSLNTGPVKGAGAIQFQFLKSGNLVTSSMTSVFLVDGNGNTIREFPNSGPFFSVNDAESEIITVSSEGLIKYIDLATGNVITEFKDTYISSSTSSKKMGLPYKISGGRFYLLPCSNGIVSLFSAEKKAVIANLFFDQQDWAVIARDGRIDGTLTAFEKIEWREYNEKGRLLNQSTVESSFDKYYTPRLLSILISAEGAQTVSQAPAPLQNIQDDVQKIPVVAISKINNQTIASGKQEIPTYSTSQKMATVEVSVVEHAEIVNDIRLYHNGKLVGTQRPNNSQAYNFTISFNSVFGENNSLYAVATSTKGIDSEKAKVLVTYKKSEHVKPRLYALIVGVNKYQNPRYELNYATPDAGAIKSQLEASKSSILESVEVTTLFDNDVTKEKINQSFSELSKKIGEQDIFIFYYAGHGTMHEAGGNQEFFIVPHDVTQLYGNEDMLRQKAVSAAELRQLSMNLNAQKQIYIIDACHSASALSAAATRGAAEEIAIAQLARSTGTFWLTAAGSDQFATEFQELGHGVFTYSLLEALQGKDQGSSADGSITIREISSYIERRVPELSQQYKGKPQYPSSFSFGNDFPLVVK